MVDSLFVARVLVYWRYPDFIEWILFSDAKDETEEKHKLWIDIRIIRPIQY